MKYGRILLKLSGEALGGKEGTGLHPEVLQRISLEIAAVRQQDIQVAVVCGGGNIFRGMKMATNQGINRTDADFMGMLATIQNGIALRSYLDKASVPTTLMTAIPMESVGRVYTPYGAQDCLSRDVVILSGGLGIPLFTTDTAAAHYAIQLQAQVLVKATDVDGIYTEDPKKSSSARRFDELTHGEAVDRRLKVMDSTAMALAEEHKLKIIVYNMEQHTLMKALEGGCPRTTVAS